MALTPYKNNKTDLNRSYSSPIKKQVYHQEVLSFGKNTLVRSYSCSQIFNINDFGEAIQTTQIKIINIRTPKQNFCDKISKSSQTIKSDFYLGNARVSNGKQTAQKSKKNIFKMSIKNSILIAFLGVFLWFYFASIECDYAWDLQQTCLELTDSVFGQENAIKRIKNALNLFDKSENMTIMVLTGTVGVGKTYASSIIAHNFPWTSKKLLSKFNYEYENKILPKSFINCGQNLIIFDDLSVNDVSLATHIISRAMTYSISKKTLLILIFTIHTHADKEEILTQLDKSYIKYYHIQFETLGIKDIKKCYLAEINYRKAVISESDLNKLIEQKMEYIDEVKGTVGCKGIPDDVSLYVSND